MLVGGESIESKSVRVISLH